MDGGRANPQRRQQGRNYDNDVLRQGNRQYSNQQFLSFDVPDTIEAYKPEKIANVPIDLGERSK